MAIKRQQPIAQTKAQHFIHRIVPPYILPENNQFSSLVKNCRRMKPARALESGLELPQLGWKGKQRFRFNFEPVGQRRKMLMDSLNRGLAAKTATRRRKHMAREPRKIDAHFRT